jgi:hypothetical protein
MELNYQFHKYTAFKIKLYDNTCITIRSQGIRLWAVIVLRFKLQMDTVTHNILAMRNFYSHDWLQLVENVYRRKASSIKERIQANKFVNFVNANTVMKSRFR